MKSFPDESNRPSIEEMLLHSYEFAMGLNEANFAQDQDFIRLRKREAEAMTIAPFNWLEAWQDAWDRGQLSVVPGKERTVREARCSACREIFPAGLRKLFYQAEGGCGWTAFCNPCFEALTVARPS